MNMDYVQGHIAGSKAFSDFLYPFQPVFIKSNEGFIIILNCHA
jgi:hypothetical protein